MNPAQLKSKFPHASRAFLEANGFAGDMLPPQVAAKSMLDSIARADLSRKTTDEEKLNKLERDYLRLLRARNLPWIGIQCITLKLGDDTRYTSDFVTIGPNGEIEFRETKGGKFWDDAKVKLKVAARMYPIFVFYLVRKSKDGNWSEVIVKP